MRIRPMCRSFVSWLLPAVITLSPAPTPSQTASQTPASSPILSAYGGCLPPSNEGFNVCSPVPTSNGRSTFINPFQVIAAATSGRAQVESIELWVDGKKVAHSMGSLFDRPVSLPQGNHALTFREVDQTGAAVESAAIAVGVDEFQQTGAAVTSALVAEDADQEVAQGCLPPDIPGVNVCSPPLVSCSTSGILTIAAAGRGKSGRVRRMELWINGTKLANFPGDHFLTNFLLYGSSYVLTINEVDEEGNTIGQSLTYDGPC